MLKQIRGHFDITKPEEYIAKLKVLERDVEQLRADFGEVWTYCFGCKGYSRVKEAYTEKTGNGRTVLCCGKCHAVWKITG